MDTPTGTLVSVDGAGGLARVRVDQPAACARCAAGRGCGAGIFARQRAGEIIEVRLMTEGLEAGSAVDILLDDGRLWRAAVFGYGYPLLGALVGAGIGVAAGDTGVAAGALGGIAAGLLVSRARLRAAPEPVPAARPSA